MHTLPPNPLFDLLGEAERTALAQAMWRTTIEAGSVFAREGEPGSSMFVIVSGELEVIKAIGTAEESVLGIRRTGDLIGETSLFHRDGERTASLRAITTLELLEMTHERFHDLLQHHPTLAYELVRTISRRQREADQVVIGDLQEKNRQLARAYAELQAAQAQIVQKEKLEKELELARNIQESILPRSIPQMAGAAFGACMLPARSVGGDLYDVIPLANGKMGIMVGDVSGKGVPAAIFMGLVRSLIRAEATRSESPAAALRRVNEHLLEMNDSSMFVTVLYGEYDHTTHRFSYARAGHELPIAFARGGHPIAMSMNQGSMLGLFPDPKIDEQVVDLSAGSTLVLFTDGATDAVDLDNDRFEHDRLTALVRDNSKLAAQALCEAVLKGILVHQGSAEQADDITLVAVTVSAESKAIASD